MIRLSDNPSLTADSYRESSIVTEANLSSFSRGLENFCILNKPLLYLARIPSNSFVVKKISSGSPELVFFISSVSPTLI